MIADIPIIIPIKELSQRCPGKNQYLLRYTARFIYAAGVENNTIVIADSENLLNFARSIGLNASLEIRKDDQDELTSCKNFLKGRSTNCFFLCPVTQPFRHPDLFELLLNKADFLSDSWDFITTKSSVNERSIFFVREGDYGDEFEIKHKNRKGSVCEPRYMIDGTLYLIKSNFLNTVLETQDPNEAFWNGRFSLILNTAPFIDIDTKDDLEKFKFLENFFGL